MDCSDSSFEGDDPLRLQILGPLRVWRGPRELDVGPHQQARVLAVLLARAEHPIPTSQLIELIWDGNAPTSALNVIHKYIGALRRTLEPSLLARSPGRHLLRRGNGYLFTAGPATVDISVFRSLVTDARRAAAEGLLDVALLHYEDALALWKGAAGDDLDHALAATDTFTALNAEFFEVCVTAADLAVALGVPQRVAGPLRIAAAVAPLHEPVHAALISVLGACGQQAEALDLFRIMRRRLADELGIEPGQALQRAHQRVLARQLPAASSGPDPAPLLPDHSSSPSTGFVGRVKERATAMEVIGAAAAGGTGVILVAGEPGIGKTRFCGELAAGASRRDVAVEWGNCLPTEGSPAMWPWLRVTESLLNRLPDDRRRHWQGGIIGRLLNPASAEVPPNALDSGARFHLFERVTEVLAEAAARQPLVLIIDDLHWADVGSLELFAHLGARLPEGAALIGAFRDRAPAPRGELTRMLAATSRLPGLHRLRLTPLPAPQVAELISIETRGVPDSDAVREIHERSGGNPFFVRELTRLLTHREAYDFDAVSGVPATVRDVVLDRIADVIRNDDDRTLLSAAALIGRTVDVKVLAQVAILDIHTCLRRLEPLDQLGILTATDNPFEVRFVHDLVREAVTDLVPPHRASGLHHRIANALETCGAPRDLIEERLAHHLWAAGPHAAQDRTVAALICAANRMTAKCAFEAAHQTLDTAIQMSRRAGLTELESDAHAHLIALVGMQSMYGSAGLMDLLARAEQLARLLGREREAIGLLYSRWAAHAQAIELDISRPLAQRLRQQCLTADDPAIRAYGLQAWGIQEWNAGNVGEAYRHLQQTRESLLDSVNNDNADPVQRDLEWLMTGMLAEIAALHGDSESACTILTAMKAAAAGEAAYTITVTAAFVCRIAVLAGDPQAVFDAARRGIAVDPNFDFVFLGTYLRLALCWAEAMTGHSPARAAVEAARLITTNLLDPPRSCVATWYTLLAEIWLEAGDHAQASGALDRAEHFLAAYSQRYPEGLLLLMRARLLRDTGAPRGDVVAALRAALATSVAAEAHLFAQRTQQLIDELADELCSPAAWVS